MIFITFTEEEEIELAPHVIAIISERFHEERRKENPIEYAYLDRLRMKKEEERGVKRRFERIGDRLLEGPGIGGSGSSVRIFQSRHFTSTEALLYRGEIGEEVIFSPSDVY